MTLIFSHHPAGPRVCVCGMNRVCVFAIGLSCFGVECLVARCALAVRPNVVDVAKRRCIYCFLLEFNIYLP